MKAEGSDRWMGAPRGRTLQVRIPPDPHFARKVREAVIAFAARFEVGPDDLEEFIFALGEALANAIEHSQSRKAIETRCRLEDDKIVAEIVDCGTGFDIRRFASAELPDPLSEGGRGLPIMHRCSDILSVRSVPGKGTAVVVGRYLQRKTAS